MGSRNVGGGAIAAWSGWAILCCIAAVTMMRMSSPPSASPADAPADSFSADRARIHLETIAREPHPVGSDAARSVQQYIVHYLTELGLRVEEQELPACTTLAELHRCAVVRNVVATLPGRDAEAAVLLSAHYDTVPNAPGASDDGAGVAALLETARALVRLGTPAHDVMFAFVDGEEELLLGSAALARSSRLSKVRLAANFESRGSRGASVLFAVSAGMAPIIAELAPLVDRPIMNSFFSAVGRVLPNGTDAEVYERWGMKTLSFAYVEGFEHYHQGTDTLPHLDLGSLEHHGQYALAIARHFANTDLQSLAGRGGDDAFFDVGGWFVVRYPLWIARLLGILMLGLLVFAISREARHAPTLLRAIAICAAIFLLFLVVVAASATFVVRLMTTGWSTWSPFVFAGAIAASIGCLEIAGFVHLLAFQRRRWGERATMLGSVAVCGTLAVVTGIFAPGASHVFLWPAAGATLLILTSESAEHTSAPGGTRPQERVPLEVIFLLPTFIFQAQVFYTCMAVIGGAVMAIPMIFGGLWLGLIAPAVVPHLERRWVERSLGRGLALVGIAAAIGVSWVGRTSAAPAVGNSVAYAVDKTETKALWVSADREQDAWKLQFLGPSPQRARLEHLSSISPLFFQAAPFVELPEPTIVIESDRSSSERTDVALRVRSRRNARTIVVWETTGARFDEWTFEGQAPLSLVRFSEELDSKGFRLLTGLGYESRFTVVLLAVPADGAVLRVAGKTRGALEFRLMDVSDDLAVVPTGFQPRGPEWTRGYPGDQTWVTGAALRILPASPH